MALLLAPVLLLPGLAWGAAGRLRPAWYPSSWLNAARLIDDSRRPGKVLLLPWTAYRRPAWNGGRALLDPWPRLLSAAGDLERRAAGGHTSRCCPTTPPHAGWAPSSPHPGPLTRRSRRPECGS